MAGFFWHAAVPMLTGRTARELVEHQDLGQAPLGRGAPGKQLTTRRSFERGAEAGAYGFAQGRVFGEVVLGGEFGEPEVEDGFR